MSRKFKILAICAFLALSIMLPALFVASPAEAAKWGNFEYEIIDGEITITKGPSRDAIVVIPAEIDGVPVTSIGKNAFYDNSRIQSVTIPDSIRVIGESAFNYCVSLEPVTIPEGVTTIGLRAFTNCRAMTSISIPDSVTIIEKEAFSNCWAMTSISIPYGITSLEDSLFYGCYNLTSVTIPDTVTSINKFAFNLCTSLESITIPDGVTTIGENAFRNCTSLESITIPDGVSTISETTFLNCTSLGFITIPDGVTSIGKEAFRDCTSLEYIAIPGTVTSIGADAFRNCISLEDFDVSSSNSHFKSEDGVLFNKAGTTLIQYPAGLGDVSYAIPPGTISIGAGAFRDCSHLESITIIDSVTSIGSEAFFGCSSLRAFNVSPSHPSYTSIDGVLFNKAGTTLIQYPAGLSDASYAIPDDVTSIQGGAFFECGHLESVTVPDSVTQIGRGAFNNTSPSLNIYFTGNAPSVTSNQLSNRATITAWWYEGSTGFPHMAKWAGVYSAMLEAPAAPVDLTLTPLYGGAILSWGAPDYNGGFDAFRYLVYVDDALVKTVADRTCELSLSVGESTISVKAENDIGIGEGASALLTLGWDLSITLPSDGDMLRPGPVTVEWAYSESAGIIDSFQVLANGEETDLDGDARSADLILKVDSYTVEVRAIDVNGDYISEQISFVVSADYDDGTFEYTLTGDYGDGPAVITGYSGPGGDVVIPEALDGKPVEAIGATAFQGDDDIVTVTVPSTVLEIGEEAFSGCSSLTDVYFLGDAPTVGGGLISDNSELIAWHFAGAEDFTTSLWMGVKIQVLNPPTAPQGLDLAPSYGGVTLTWEAPDDDGSLPVEFYIVQVDGVEVGTLTDTTLWLELDASEHSIGVTAGNRLIFGPEASGIVDLSRELEITGHSGDSPIRPGAVTIHWSYDESSSMVDHFLVILDGVEQQLPANARSHELTLKVGERVIKVEAVDSRGGSIFDQTVLMVSADYGDGTFEYALTGEMGDGPAVITSYVGIGRDVTVPATLGGKPVETIEASAFQGNDDIIIVRIPASVTHMGEGAFSGCGSLTDVLFLGDAPAVGGDRLSDDAGLMAWFQEGAEDFTTPSWMGVGCDMLQPLTTPRNLVLTPLYGGVILSWDAPDGGAPATEFYVVSVDGIAVEMLTDTTLFLALDANEHSISIVAGNRFTFGPEASVTVELSRSLEIVSPADGTLIRPGTVNVEWTYSEGADIASRFLVIVNGEELEADDDASSMDLLLKVGSYTVEVRAIDVNGDYISEQISFLVSADYDDGVFEYTLTGEMGDGPAVITGYIGLGGDVIIPATLGGKPVAAIGDGAFGGNDDITSLTLPASVTSIADGAFLGCSSLEAFVVSPTNPSYGSIDGVLLSKDGTTLIQYPAGLGGESYTVPEGVTQIEGGAFRSCRSLEIILIPASVTTIGEGAFFDCDLLADIYFCGDAPTVGGNLLSDGSELRAWWYEGKSGFVHEGIWAGVYTAMLEAPTAPTGLTLTPLYNGVFLSWESPEGEGSFPVEFYIVSIGGVEVETLTGTTLLLELDVDEYSIGVAAGNRFIIGLEASVAVDLSRELEITGHSGGSLIRPGTVTIQWSYDESSGMVDHFLVILDGVEEQLPSDARSHELTLKVGERVIKVEAVDSRGGSILDQIALMVSADYDDGVFKYTLTGEMGDGPAVITGYIGTGGDVTIPANLGGQPVEAIGDGAFAGCTSLETLRIGAGVKDIGAGILDGCTALSSVHFDGDAPTVDGDLSDQDGFTVYYSEGAQGFSSTWAGATTQAVFPPSGEGDDGFYPILIGAVALLVILGVAIILIRRR